jgi:hypothetical protein
MKQILKYSTPVKYGRVLNNLSQIFLISLNPIQLFDKESRQSNSGKTASFFVGVIYNFSESTIPPPPGGTAILPEYIHYYGYYYQVIVQCLST